MFESGTDTYMSKTIRTTEIDHYRSQAASGVSEQPYDNCSEAPVEHQSIRNRLEEMFGDDSEVLHSIATMFLETYPQLLDEIRNAISVMSAGDLERSAHSLKGSVGNFCTGKAMEIAASLEAMGRTRDFANAEEALMALEFEMRRLEPAITALTTV